MNKARTLTAIGVAVGMFSVGGVAYAATQSVRVEAGRDTGARLTCPGGMSRLGHVFSEQASVFPGDPSPHISLATNIPDDGFQVELVETGTHTGTHLDAPGHFIEGGRTVDQLDASEFVWPAYVIDVRARMATAADDGFQLSIADVKAYERKNGKIPKKALVIIRTGFDKFYGTPAFLDAAPGFSGDTVQWMVTERRIGGVASDTFGPDATSDADFAATYTILDNDRVALPGLNNVDSLSINSDIVMAPTVALKDGSGYQTDPLACHGARSTHSDNH
jgi:kynurenine formamidase